MGDYKPLISEATWDRVCTLYQELLSQGLAIPERTPFLPIAQPGFGEDGGLSIIYCGIALGNAPSTKLRYEERVEELSKHFAECLPDDYPGDPGSTAFWSDVASVRAAIREAGHFSSIRIAWANAIPINNNSSESSAQPSGALLREQKKKRIAEDIWRELCQAPGVSAIVATFGKDNLDLSALSDLYPSGVLEMNGLIWKHAGQSNLPPVVWANHANGRWTEGGIPTAADIAASLLTLLPAAK